MEVSKAMIIYQLLHLKQLVFEVTESQARHVERSPER